MELKLNIYEKGKVVKTYTANEFMLTTGLCEDLLKMIDIDKFIGGDLPQKELGIEIVKIVVKCFPKLKPFFQDVFDGLTNAEYRATSINEVADIVKQIISFTVQNLSSVRESQKN